MAYKVLDVSKFNPIQDYAAAAADDLDGVIMRIGYRGYGSSGSLNTDDLFTTHYNGFHGKGVKLGFYWFTQAISEAEAVEEANYAHSLLQGKQVDFPVYIDSEYSNTSHDGRADGLSASARTDYLIAFCDRMIELGYRAGVYASDAWFVSNLELSRIQAKDYSLWVARYSSNPPEKVSSYDGWQYTSSGTIAGYDNRVDLSHFYTDVAGWGGGSTPTGKDISTMNFTLTPTEVNYHGGPNQPEVTIKDASENTLVYTVDYDKEYQDNINAGTGKLIVTGKGNFYGTKTLTFIINPLDITPGASIEPEGPDSDGCYNLDNIEVSCMGLPMEKDKDYTLSIDEYEEEGYKKAKVTITAIDGSNFTGYYYERFPIEKLPDLIDISNFTIELSGTSFPYTGESIEPFTNLLDEDESVVSESEYEVSYEDNLNAGIATVTITAKDINYTGTKTVQFTITALSLTEAELTCGNPDVEGCYNLDNLKVLYQETILEENTDYEKEVTTEEQDGFIVSNVMITGIGNYKDTVSGSYKTEKLLIDIATLTATLDLDSLEVVYSGEEYKPNMLIEHPELEATVLIKDEDYTLTYSEDTVNVGIVKVTATGIGNYTGTKELAFEIVPFDFTETVEVECGLPDEKNLCYDLKNLQVKVEDKILVEDTDYTKEVTEDQEGKYINSTVDITGINNYSGTKSEVFRTSKVLIDISEYVATILDDVSNLVYTGEAYTPEVFVSEDLVKDTDYTVEYQDNIDAGTAKIIIKGIGDYTGTINLTFEIKKINLEDNKEVVVYCGEPDEEECYNLDNLQVTYKEKLLKKDTDYTITTFETEDEVKFEVITTVSIFGKGNYEGTITKAYKTGTIDPFAIDINSLEITIDADDENPFIYNGTEFKPKVTIKDEDEVLEENTDYTVIYRNNINAGTGVADITGIDKYRGNKTMMFAIDPYNFTETVEVTCGETDDNGYYDLDNLKIVNDGKTLIEDQDYILEIQEETTEEQDYIKNTVVVEGIHNYTGTKTVIINSAKDELFSPTDLSTFDLILDQSTFTFSGKAFEPETQVKKDDLILTRDEDYEVEYFDNTNAGVARVVATAIGETYTGSVETVFNILPKDLSEGAITCGAADEDGCYDITNLTVTVDEVELIRNTDYSYQITTERVDYTIISTIQITGINNYKGSAEAKFKTSIIVIDVNDVDISLNQTEFIYTSELIVPEIVTELELNVDYEVEYQDSINFGDYVVTIRGIGHYTGIRELEYHILRKSIEEAEVTCGEASSEGIYDINNLKVVVDDKELRPSVDYQFTTSEREAESGFHETVCYIYGINNYTGSITKSFVTSRDQIYAGKTIQLELCTVYPRFGSRKSDVKKTGTFYLWDNQVVNNRIRLTNNPDGIGKPGYLTGWVDIENVIARTDIRIGDKVLVNGKITAYADGTGNTIRKTNIIMYIVDILDAESFSHNFGVASDINRNRQGWASADMIKRIEE